MTEMKLCKICNAEKAVKECMEGRYRCIDCHVRIEKERYHRDKEKGKDKRKIYREKNKDKENDRAKNWYKNNTEKAKTRELTKYYNDKDNINMKRVCGKYRITEKQYKAIIDKANGKCQICGTIPDKGCIDHDHNMVGVESIRGFLCNNCNSGIGFLNDNVNVLRKAVKYLDKFNISVDDHDGSCAYFFGLKCKLE